MISNRRKQVELDKEKWEASEKEGRDLTGKMSYCIKCPHRNYPFLECCVDHKTRVLNQYCAKAYNIMRKNQKKY